MNPNEQPQQPSPPQQAVYGPPQPNQPYPQPPVPQKTDVLGIISIVFAFIGLAPIGLILAVVGLLKAKKEKRSNILSIIGLVMSIVVTLIIGVLIMVTVASYGSIQVKARDAKKQSDVMLLRSGLENNYVRDGYYPSDITGIASESGVTAADYKYSPEPTGCQQCRSYALSTNLESGEVYSVKSLEQ